MRLRREDSTHATTSGASRHSSSVLIPVNRCRIQSKGVSNHMFGGQSRFFSPVDRPDASTRPMSPAERPRLTRVIGCRTIVSSVKIGPGVVAQSGRGAVHVQLVGAGRGRTPLKSDALRIDPSDVS